MSIKCQNFSPKIQLWKNWPFVRESNGVLFSNTHQTVVRWPWHDMISFFYSFLVVEKSCKVFLFKSWHGKKIAWGSSKQMIHTVHNKIVLLALTQIVKILNLITKSWQEKYRCGWWLKWKLMTCDEGIQPLLQNFSPLQTIFDTFDVMTNEIVIISTNDESNCNN